MNKEIKFTKKEKLQIFTKTLEIIKFDYDNYGGYISGLCFALLNGITSTLRDISYDDAAYTVYHCLKTAFPEIYKYKPHKRCVFWWCRGYDRYGKIGTKKRMNVLKTEIEELKNIETYYKNLSVKERMLLQIEFNKSYNNKGDRETKFYNWIYKNKLKSL